MRIEVALPDGADYVLRQVDLPPGATAADALNACGSAPQHMALGVFGRPVRADTPLRDGDRLEVYPPLRVDPKTARRRRAAAREKISPGGETFLQRPRS